MKNNKTKHVVPKNKYVNLNPEKEVTKGDILAPNPLFIKFIILIFISLEVL